MARVRVRVRVRVAICVARIYTGKKLQPKEN
jgi:hypothetical protein